MLPELISHSGIDYSLNAIPVWLDLSAVAVGSISGVLVAQEKKLDLVGYIALSMLGGLGGGLVRDCIMQTGSVYMLSSIWPLTMILLAAAIGFLFPSSMTKHPHLLEWIDIISVGLFVAAGTDKAILYHLNPLAILFMGIVTGVGGGMLRDVFLGDTPKIFQKSNFYAICAFAGALMYYLPVTLVGINRPYAAILCVVATVVLRRISLHFNLMSPEEYDIAPRVKMRMRMIKARSKSIRLRPRRK